MPGEPQHGYLGSLGMRVLKLEIGPQMTRVLCTDDYTIHTPRDTENYILSPIRSIKPEIDPANGALPTKDWFNFEDLAAARGK